MHAAASPLMPVVRPHPIHVAVTAIRPKTLGLSVVPVLVGTSLAVGQQHALAWMPFALALVCALLIQIATNLHNDARDGQRGTDGPGRLGPPRVTASGWASADQVLLGSRLCLGAALLLGTVLVNAGGWPILVAGIASLLGAWSYSGGARPASDGPWGEGLVILFFGWVAVCGSHWLQAHETSAAAWLAGAATGTPAAAVLLINNLRDLDSDFRNGRRTLAWRLGLTHARRVHALLLMAPYPLLGVLAAVLSPIVLLGLLSLPVAARRILAMHAQPPGAWLNAELASTARLCVLNGLLLSASFLAQRVMV